MREATARADGFRHIDTPRLIAQLQDLGANHYTYGIWDSASDFDDLRNEFLPAAQAVGIQVMPYIVPPTETHEIGRASRPYRLDYVAWARAFAELSLEFPVLTAWAIDDFDIGGNSAVFTPEYLGEVRAAQFEINDALGFFTCAYFQTATEDAFYERYAPFIDGVIYPYLDGDNENTLIASTSGSEIQLVRDVAGRHGVEVLWLVYTGRFLDAPAAPTEAYVAEALTAAVEASNRGELLGVIAYGAQVDGAPTVANERRSMYGDGRGALAASRRRVARGSFAELSTRVTVDPDSARHEFSFWHSRTIAPRYVVQPGDFALHVLLDGAQIWEGDVVEGSTWLGLYVQADALGGVIDVGWALRGKSEATLAFRLTALRDVEGVTFDVGLDNLETIGWNIPDAGFEDPAAWTATSTGGPVTASIDRFIPDRPAQILRAIASVFRT